MTIRKINYTVIAPEVEQEIKDKYTKAETDSKLAGKVNNSQVLTNVPVDAKFTDTIYTHPANHLASIIIQDSNNRFTTDVEKANWNAKGSSNLALGETSSTAYRGDRGKISYDHSQSTHAPVDAGLIIP